MNTPVIVLIQVMTLTNLMTPLQVMMKIQDARTLLAASSVYVLTVIAMSMVFVLIMTNDSPLTVLISACVSQASSKRTVSPSMTL